MDILGHDVVDILEFSEELLIMRAMVMDGQVENGRGVRGVLVANLWDMNVCSKGALASSAPARACKNADQERC